MVWILTVFLFWAPSEAAVVQVELSAPEQCESAAMVVAETAARDGALGIQVIGCRSVAQDV